MGTVSHPVHHMLTLFPHFTPSLTDQVIVIKQYDEGTKERSYGHVVVAGIERYPLKVTKSMGAKKLAKRSKVKPFIKVSRRGHSGRAREWRKNEGDDAVWSGCTVRDGWREWASTMSDTRRGGRYEMTRL